MGEQKATKVQNTTATSQFASAIASHKSSLPTTHPLWQLQRKIGNQAVSQLIQAKLKVGKPNDVYEMEADHVAYNVMRMSEPLTQGQPQEPEEETAQAKSTVGTIQRQPEEQQEETAQTKPIVPITPLVQRQAQDKEEETAQMLQRQATEDKDETAQMLQRQATEDKDETAQTKGTADTTPEVTPHVEKRIQTMRGGGQPLAESTRSFFESRFGYNFGGVLVHTDSQAAEIAGQLNAQAFTIGRDIFFGAGRYEPHTSSGQFLLAHELTHTLQQNPTPPLTVKRKIQQPQSDRGGGNPSLGWQKKNAIAISPNSHPTIQRKVSGNKAPASPAQDPAFQAVVKKAQAAASQQKQHPPAKSKTAEAQAAALPPANDITSKAAGKQVQQMDQQQAKAFNRDAFKTALLAKIEAAAPKNLEQVDKFKESGKLGAVKAALAGQVDATKQQSQGGIEAKVKGTPDPSGIAPKSVTPLPANPAGAPPAGIDAAQAAPKPKTNAEISLQEGSQSLDKQMADADVTEDQLKKSNEPDFLAAADAKQQAQKDAVIAPQEYRQSEQALLTQAQSQAVTTAQTQLAEMHVIRGQTQNKTTVTQKQAKNQDEQKRHEVANELQTIYTQTKKAAEDRLTRLDTEVNQAFDKGANAAQQAFEDGVKRDMDDYKAKQGWAGEAWQWLKERLGFPSEVDKFYHKHRSLYIENMDQVLNGIAILVEKGLNEAKNEIAKGRRAIEAKLEQQPANLRKALQEDAQKIQSDFDKLEQSVEDKQEQLIDSLTQKYNEKLQAIDARIEEMKAQNKSWVDAAKEALGGAIKTIQELKTMLLGLLGNAAAIKKIIKNPIGFLGNLVAGVKQGFMNFVGNIAAHLQQGLMGWLFGALAQAGIQLPDSFDLKGILSLIMQVLGATWAFIRARAVKILGEKVVKAMETTAGIFQILISQGIMGVWDYIQEQLSNLADVVLAGIKSFVTDSIIKAGVTWIVGLLNPAGAFIKACKAIYDIIMFFVERGSQIAALVNAVVGSVSAIADGAIGAAASAVENALGKAVPVAISFLAALLGITGISKKIREVIEKVQAPVGKAIDWLIQKAYDLVKAAGKLLGFGKDKKDEREADEGAGEYIYEKSVGGGHKIKIRKDLKVFRFSTPTMLSGSDAQKQQQDALESVITPVPPTYPTDSLGRASGPSGYVKGVKDGEERENLPGLKSLPGGIPAYQPGDHRGHLIGDRFYGSSGAGNLVPMHATLNLSTFKSYENTLAESYKALLKAEKGVLLFMQITPNYPGSDASKPASYRPTTITANSKIITLKEGAPSLTIEEQVYPNTFINPNAVVSSVNLNTDTEETLQAALSIPLAKFIFQERTRGGKFADLMDLQLRLALLPEAQAVNLNEILIARANLITL
ncbi:eCIS core domain-containing protein [Anabaena azotica]|uniref:DUF4157 domain-containing protein n=1 Tax=Anabaena azotica FACHB-119 TaxID=947527 RepID=A0ABR8DC51_9NOST|nr:DUF4157 domain-containing protein [Anabaena azotica]MBD2503797.1 DUF4157 domain-containing protein [Anabaena azotica FACHB-119]